MRIRLHKGALADLDEATLWYEDQQIGLGGEFLAEVGRGLGLIAETPHVWPLWRRARRRQSPVRRFLLGQFPYGIAYQVIDESIVVLSVAAHKQRPRYWSGRVQR